MTNRMLRILSKYRTPICNELITWGKISFLTTIQEITELLPWLVSLAFIGNIDSSKLAALSLVEIWLYTFLEIEWMCLGQTTSTLISQADGLNSGSAKHGWLAIALIVTTIMSGLVTLACWFTRDALQLLTDDISLVEEGAMFAIWVIPAVFTSSYLEVIASYLIAIDYAEYPTIVSIIFSLANIIVNYCFLFGGNGWLFGITWPPLSSNILFANAMSWVCCDIVQLLVLLIFFKNVIDSESAETKEGKEEDDEEVEEDQKSILLPVEMISQSFNLLKDGVKPKTNSESSNEDTDEDDAEEDEEDNEDDENIDEENQNPLFSLNNLISNVPLLSHQSEDSDSTNSSLVALSQDSSIYDWISSLKAWKTFLNLLFPFMITACSETMIFFVLGCFVIQLNRSQIAAHNTASAIIEVAFCVVFGMCDATTVRIGYYIGKADYLSCQLVIWIGMTIGFLIGIIVSVICTIFNRELAELFTYDEEIILYIRQVAPLLWASFLFFAMGDQMLAVLDGQGRGNTQMLCSFLGLWCVTFPLAAFLFSFMNGELYEIWASLVVGYIVNEIVASYFVYYSDWESLFEQAKDHVALD